jgi:nitrogen regulatory protein PII
LIRVVINVLDSGNNLIKEVVSDFTESSDLSVKFTLESNVVRLVTVASIDCSFELIGEGCQKSINTVNKTSELSKSVSNLSKSIVVTVNSVLGILDQLFKVANRVGELFNSGRVFNFVISLLIEQFLEELLN